MTNDWLSLFVPRSVAGGRSTVEAMILSTTLLLMLALGPVFAVLRGGPITQVITLPFILTVLLTFYILRRGRVTHASTLYITAGWVYITILLFLEPAPFIIVSYVIGCMLAGYLLNGYVALLYAGITSAALWSAYIQNPVVYWKPDTISGLVLVALLVFISERASNRNLNLLEQSQAHLQQREQDYRRLVDDMPTACYILHLDTLTLRYANQAALAFGGMTTLDDLRDHLHPNPLTWFMQDDTAQQRLAQYRAGRTTLPPVEYDIQVNNRIVSSMVQSRVIMFEGERALLTICQDISSVKMKERDLAERERTYRHIVEDAPVGIAQINLDTGGLYYCNAIGRRILDVLPDAVGLTQIEAMFQTDRLLLARDEVKATGRVQERDVELQTPSGRPVSLIYSAIQDQADGHALFFFIDFTERRGAEAYQYQIRQERQMRDLRNSIVSLMSHEFRTPFAVIKSSANSLERYIDQMTDDKRTNHLRKISTQVDQLTQLLDNILLYSKAKSGLMAFNPQKLDLALLLADLVSQFNRRNPTHYVNLHVTGTFEDTFIDADLVTIIIGQLLDNAVRYAGTTEPIQVQLQRESRQQAVISVQDHGVGISETQQMVVLRQFQRGKNTETIKGTGLGLTLAQNSAELHGGSLELQSPPDGGTVFIIRLALQNSTPSRYDVNA